MSGPTGSASAPSGSLRRLAPAAAIILVALLAGLSVGSGFLVANHLRKEALVASRIYSIAIRGTADPDPQAINRAIFEVVQRVRSLGLPLMVTGVDGKVTAADNLPFQATLDDPRTQAYVRELDRVNPPLLLEGIGAVHFGPLPASRLLLSIAVLQALTLLVMVAVGVVAYRNATTAQRDRMWVAMAREAAHQMGTPITSLQGWIEQLRAADLPPGTVANHLTADAERLERVAQRFERIGNPARRDPVALGALAERVVHYFRPRVPRHANAIVLSVRAPSAGPVIAGDAVLLEWALEAIVKNAIDALGGRGGSITVAADQEQNEAVVRVIDDGPGIPREIRRTLFQPGVTTKRRGWGIGLALARRVVEDAHGGSLSLEPVERGTTLMMRFPSGTPSA